MEIKCLVKDKTTLELQEDGTKGDTIDLSKLSNVDLNNLSSLISKETEQLYEKKYSSIIKEKENAAILKANEERIKETSDLKNKITQLESENKNLNQSRENEIKLKENEIKEKYDTEINDLKTKLNNSINEVKNEKDNKKQEMENLVLKLNSKFIEEKGLLEKQKNQEINEQKNKYENEINDLNFQIRKKDEELENEKNYKQKLNVKLRGEDLETHCYNVYQEATKYGAFPNADFYKDNDAVEGDTDKKNKGDFIFKDYNNKEKEIEYISIMFELKNENPTSVNKHKNKDFYQKLDGDRKRKKCKYAILVSCLEIDNPLFDDGIVKINDYENMYVIRPQFLMPLINLLTNAEKGNINNLMKIKENELKDLDLKNFNDELNKFKESFMGNVGKAKKKFDDAIKNIDDTVKKLIKIREELEDSSRQLTFAGNKVEEVTTKKLAKNSPSIKEEAKKIEKNS